MRMLKAWCQLIIDTIVILAFKNCKSKLLVQIRVSISILILYYYSY